MKKQRPIIGILGGMGPQASAKLVQILVDLSTKEFGAKNNDDFPEIVLDSIPVPDFISNKKDKQAALTMLKERVKRINKMQINILAISCNTVHILLKQLEAVSQILFISMVDEVAEKVKNAGIERVGLLASPTTIHSGLFQRAIGPGRLVWLKG